MRSRRKSCTHPASRYEVSVGWGAVQNVKIAFCAFSTFPRRNGGPSNRGSRLRDFHLARELARRASFSYLGLRNPQDPPPIAPPAEAFDSSLIVKDRGYTPGKLLRGFIGPVPVNVLNCWTQ